MIPIIILSVIIIVAIAAIWKKAVENGRLKSENKEIKAYNAAQRRMIGALSQSLKKSAKYKQISKDIDNALTADDFERVYKKIISKPKRRNPR